MVADQEHENFDEVLEKGDLLEGEIHNCATVSALLHRRSMKTCYVLGLRFSRSLSGLNSLLAELS